MTSRAFSAIALALVSSVLTLTPRHADAQQPQPPSQPAPTKEDVDELTRRLDLLAKEVEELRSGEVAAEQERPLSDAARRALGLAPSAASTYRKRQGVSLAGYGELLYERFADEDQRGASVRRAHQLDFLRAILYAGYRFNDRFVFNSEIEIEHANEAFVEFAYLDFTAHAALTLRGGLLLLPLGLVNEFHEPTVFIGAKRSETESRIIPSTWRENGVGALGSRGPISYRAYIVNGLNASGFSSDGLRGGRQRGSRALAEHLAFAGRVDVAPVPGAFAGLGLYTGGSAQRQFVVDGRLLDVDTTIVEAHGQVQMRGFDVRALWARASVDEAAALNRARNLASNRAVAEAMQGGYVQAGYNVLSQRSVGLALTPYYRLEHIDTQNKVPAGYVADLSRDGTFHTLGVELKPIASIVVKADYQWIRTVAQTGRNQLNVSLGYAF